MEGITTIATDATADFPEAIGGSLSKLDFIRRDSALIHKENSIRKEMMISSNDEGDDVDAATTAAVPHHSRRYIANPQSSEMSTSLRTIMDDSSSSHQQVEDQQQHQSQPQHYESLPTSSEGNRRSSSFIINRASSNPLPFSSSARGSGCGLPVVSGTSSKVRFTNVHVRDYERDIGDNPSCSSGPPIGIGWAHADTKTIDVDSYERTRRYRREESDMVLTRHERENLLSTWGIEPPIVANAVRANHKVKNQRRQTVRNLSKTTIEENMERATRTIQKLLLLRKSTNREAKRLHKQSLLATRTSSIGESESEKSSSVLKMTAPPLIDETRVQVRSFETRRKKISTRFSSTLTMMTSGSASSNNVTDCSTSFFSSSPCR